MSSKPLTHDKPWPCRVGVCCDDTRFRENVYRRLSGSRPLTSHNGSHIGLIDEVELWKVGACTRKGWCGGFSPARCAACCCCWRRRSFDRHLNWGCGWRWGRRHWNRRWCYLGWCWSSRPPSLQVVLHHVHRHEVGHCNTLRLGLALELLAQLGDTLTQRLGVDGVSSIVAVHLVGAEGCAVRARLQRTLAAEPASPVLGCCAGVEDCGAFLAHDVERASVCPHLERRLEVVEVGRHHLEALGSGD